jgi:hypothetical protein
MPTGHGTSERHAGLAGVRKPAEKETAGEGTKGRPGFGVSARTGGRFFMQPEGYRTKTAAELFYFVPTFAAEPTGSLKCA